MGRDEYLGFRAGPSGAKTKDMVRAFATFDNGGELLRFVLHDFSTAADKRPHYVLNIHKLKDARDRTGKNLGEPVRVPAAAVLAGEAEAKRLGLGDADAGGLIILHALLGGRVKERLKAESGACPREFSRLIARFAAHREQLAVDAEARRPAPSKARKAGWI